MARWLRTLLRAVKRWFRGFSNSLMSVIPRTSYQISPLKLTRFRKWRRDNQSSLYLGAERLELLRDLRKHQGWAVFNQLIEHRLDIETEQLCKVQPEDQTNFRRGILEAYVTLHGLVDQTLEELDKYYDRRTSDDRKQSEQRGPDISKFWGASHFYDSYNR